MYWFSFSILVSTGIFITIRQCSAFSKQSDLIKSLFNNYDSAAMPSNWDNLPVTVHAHLIISRISDVDDQKQTVTIAALVSMYWTDSSLCWNPADYSNITQLVVPAEKIWRPDMFINSLADGLFKIDNLPANLVSGSVNSTRFCFVSYPPAGFWTFSCYFDTAKFPFDVQECWIVLRRYFPAVPSLQLVNDSDKIQLTEDAARSNGLWDVVETKAEMDPDMRNVIFSFKLKRKSGYYVMYIIVPLLIMATLNVMVFCLPADSGEKISLSITILLAFTIVLITLQGMTPPSADSMPILTGGTVGLMIISTLGVVITVVVVKIDKCDDDREISRWLMLLAKCCTRRNTVADRVQAISSTETEKRTGSHPTTWRKVAAGVDRIAFCFFFIGEIVLILITGIRMATWKETHVQPSW